MRCYYLIECQNHLYKREVIKMKEELSNLFSQTNELCRNEQISLTNIINLIKKKLN